MQNPYHTLGVSPHATFVQIKQAYRRLAKLYHPDRNAGDTKKMQQFKDITAAYRLIRDQRAIHDRIKTSTAMRANATRDSYSTTVRPKGEKDYHDDGSSHSTFTAQRGGAANFSAHKDKEAPFGGVFADFLRNRGTSAHPRGAPSWKTSQDSSLNAKQGSHRSDSTQTDREKQQYAHIDPRTTKQTFTSKGKWNTTRSNTSQHNREQSRAGSSASTDKYSSLRSTRDQALPIDLQVTFTQAALGTTKTITQKHGNDVKTFEVTVPAGCTDQQLLRLRGASTTAKAREIPRDIVVRILVEPHPFFVQKGKDVYLDVPVSLSEAILGAKLEIPSLDGVVVLKIPGGTSSGKKMRLKGRGIPDRIDARRGDFYVVIQIMLPATITPELRALAQEIETDHHMRDYMISKKPR